MIVKTNLYDTFACIADACDFDCCHGWKIGVDQDTYDRWTDSGLSSYTEHTESFKDAYAIRLDQDHICPFLNEQGLCRIVLKHGPEMLSRTCDTFPREKHTYEKEWTGRQEDYEEQLLLTSCPVVVDLLKEVGFQSPFEESEDSFVIPSYDVNTYYYKGPDEILHPLRNYAMQLAKNPDFSIETVFLILHYILLDLYDLEGQESYHIVETEEALLTNLDTLDFEEDLLTVLECNDLFLDLTKNYRKQGLYASYLTDYAKVAFEIGETENAAITYSDEGFQKTWLAHETLLKNWLASKLFESALLPEDTLDDVILNIEWILVQYTAIRHMSYLTYLENKTIPYKAVTNHIILAGRMMGYSQEDIVEYMEASFDDPVWDWGYLALLTGRM